jgi:myo-inositol-1(or 4)-monophosphatase
MISTELIGKYPLFKFLGEETYQPGMQLTDAPTFVVDPIDGTTNFIHTFPNVCISLGFVTKKVPTVGVIYNPFRDELYTAIKGSGAYLTRNGGEKQRLPLKVRPEPLKDLSTSLVGIEWGNERGGANFDLKVRVFKMLAADKEDGGSMVHSLRCLGSVALSIVAISAGQLDLFWDGGW